MELLSIDLGSKKFSNSKILLYGKCIPIQFGFFLRKLSKGKIILAVCLQEQHMDNLGFKLVTLLTYQPVKEITVLTIDGSPHCVQLHALAEQAKKITKSGVFIKHYVIEEGELIEFNSDIVKVARHLSHIKELYAQKKEMKKKLTNKELQRIRTPEFIRLFWYANKISNLIGRKKALRILEEFVIKKRLDWLKENQNSIKLVKGSPLERAFKIFYKMNQRLNLKDAKVVKRNKNIIITRWFNYCPVLEACEVLGIDTREICKNVYDKPNRLFFSKLDPNLKFRRNYKKIRPYADCCEEIIELKT